MVQAKYGTELAQIVDTSGHTQTIIVQTSDTSSIEVAKTFPEDRRKRKKSQTDATSASPPSPQPEKNTFDKNDKRKKYIEPVSAFKCKICNHLGQWFFFKYIHMIIFKSVSNSEFWFSNIVLVVV